MTTQPQAGSCQPVRVSKAELWAGEESSELEPFLL